MTRVSIKKLRKGRPRLLKARAKFSKNPILIAAGKRRLHFLRRGRRLFLQSRVLNFKRHRLPIRLKKLFYFFYFLPIFHFLKFFLSNSIRKIIPSHPEVRSLFYGLNKKNFNILDILDLVDLYLKRRRLSTTKTLYTLLKVLKKLSRRQKLTGFKFLLAGRFTRRDRATYVWKTYGGVSLGSKLSGIEYFSFPIFLNYSKCVARL